MVSSTGNVASDAARATLTVSTTLLEKDQLLQQVIAAASPLQFTVIKKAPPKKKKGGAGGDELKLLLVGGEVSLSSIPPPVELTQRNAILRALCGPALHYALDHAPHYFLGGHGLSLSGGGGGAAEDNMGVPSSASSALALAGISSWMSVASSIREDTTGETVKDLLPKLDAYLATRSFLIPNSPKATLADYDMQYAIADKSSEDENLLDGLVNVNRWMGTSPSASASVPIAPVFFYGDEPEEVVAAATAAAAPIKSAPVAKGSAKPAAVAAGGLTEEQKKAAAEKRAKKNADKAGKKAKQPQQKGGKNQAAADFDISALDIRVGQIVKVWKHESADKLYCESIDVGEKEPRNIASGLRPFYELDGMENKRVLVLCNLKARNLVGFPSHGMVLCASNADHTKVKLIAPPEDAKLGDRLMFGDFKGDAEAESKVGKKKLLEKLLPDLKTDGDGSVVWKGVMGKVGEGGGPCVAEEKMADAMVG